MKDEIFEKNVARRFSEFNAHANSKYHKPKPLTLDKDQQRELNAKLLAEWKGEIKRDDRVRAARFGAPRNMVRSSARLHFK